MSVQMVLLPVFALVGLAFALMLWRTRSKSAPGADRPAPDGLREPFDLPVLFYVLVAIALPLRKMDLVLVLLSWVFVVARYADAGVFLTASGNGRRGPVWLAGALVLLAMWLYFALRILLLI
ncbi:hypothetical protein LPW26_20755 [Rhodopseudomonas sp. HC1]|uniref:MAPEG family protein n=1 Tax=Rhodopseudomonas infernalis TaxID=2897386 RepID=UPI001EE8260E|nr:MAPEG family protein [Rhodopseudomonas infernalis]MCG6207083.1 hypothetical protein [Rhodopseudomonas infernalis]